MSHILVIEDDRHISELIKINLADDSTEVTVVFDGNDGFLEATSHSFDLIILDLMLPGMKGMDICRELRASRIATPILMLTSKSDEIDKILGLETGADDYMTKPFSVRELQARVKAILRRTKLDAAANESDEKNPIHVKNLFIDQSKRKVELEGERLKLTPKEFDLVCLLAENAGKTYSRSQLLSQVWGQEYAGYEHTVNSHINRLRSKLERDPNNPEYILTTWGVGYRFTDEF